MLGVRARVWWGQGERCGHPCMRTSMYTCEHVQVGRGHVQVDRGHVQVGRGHVQVGKRFTPT